MADEETGTVLEAIKGNRLPEGFWNLHSFEGNEGLHDIHAQLVERLQDEAPDADVLELMMMERICFLYIFMRAKESNGDELPNFDRNYKEMMQLWVSMAADLRKVRIRAEESQSIRMTIVSEVSKALKGAMKNAGVDPSIANKVQTQLVTLVAG